MKRIIAIIVIPAIGTFAAIIGFRLLSTQRPLPVRMPPNAFLVSVLACDVEDAWVLPFKVTTKVGETNLPIEDVAITHYTLSTFCQWSDCTTRTIRVEADGHLPREYTISGKKDIIAVLYPQNE